MKRLLTIGFFVTAAAAILAMPSVAAKDTKGPACVNFTFGDAGYFRNPTNDSGVGNATMTLDAPACADATYSLDVYDFSGTTLLHNDVAPTSVVSDTVTFDYSFGAGDAPDNGVCLVAESHWKGHVADRAPNSGCQQIAAQSSGGGEGFS